MMIALHFPVATQSRDRFFDKFAGQNQFHLHIGTTYVAVHESEILGFVTLSATSITIGHLPKSARKRLPRHPLTALRLARLAVARKSQEQGIGKQLLRATFRIAHEMAHRTVRAKKVAGTEHDNFF